ncbi:PEP phosphonomutase-like protein [Streptococcus pneumoniae]|nr:PEP phosphonomutase-like protein [Streptococcus pneumoniae]
MVEIIYFLIIIIASGLGSISGMGGGIIIKPLMDSFGYHSVSDIAFYSSFSVFIMAIISTIKRFSQSKEIKWRLIFTVSFSSVLGGFLGHLIKAVQTAKENFSGLIIAGKMHGAGVNEPVAELSVAEQLLEAGADVILVPAVGTVPAFHDQELREVVDLVHSKGGLVLSAIGTSQETSDTDTIKEIALRNKICGVDIQHIGDAGYGGLATVDNIYALSKAIRGVRHTVSRLARSVNR